jgi:hypothetical protein
VRRRQTDGFAIYVLLNDNTDNTIDLIRSHAYPEGIHDPIVETQDYGVRDRHEGDYRNKVIRAVMCDKFNRIHDLGESFDHTTMVSSDHLLDADCIPTLLESLKWWGADAAGPLITSDALPHHSNLFRRYAEGCYEPIPPEEVGDSRVLAPNEVTVANLLWSRKACRSGIRWEMPAIHRESYEYRMCERLKASMRVIYDPKAIVHHLVAGWSHEGKT